MCLACVNDGVDYIQRKHTHVCLKSLRHRGGRVDRIAQEKRGVLNKEKQWEQCENAVVQKKSWAVKVRQERKTWKSGEKWEERGDIGGEEARVLLWAARLEIALKSMVSVTHSTCQLVGIDKEQLAHTYRKNSFGMMEYQIIDSDSQSWSLCRETSKSLTPPTMVPSQHDRL